MSVENVLAVVNIKTLLKGRFIAHKFTTAWVVGVVKGVEKSLGPMTWEELEQVTRLTLDLAKLPPDTVVPKVHLSCVVSWGVLMYHDGTPPEQPLFQRPMLLEHYIQFLIAITHLST
jgi:hypothetical protein